MLPERLDSPLRVRGLPVLAARVAPWLLPLFLLGLMLSAGLARNLAVLMAAGGLVLAVAPGRHLDHLDRRFMLACAVLPAAYLLNMALLGWNARALDRPAHLLAAMLVYLLFRRLGISRPSVLFGLAVAGLAAGAVAAMAVGSGGGQGLLALNSGRPMGPFSSPGPFGNYSAVVAVAGLAGGLAVGGRPLAGAPALALLAIAGGLMAALLSETRSAWAALPLMSIAVLIMPGRRPIPRRWVIAGSVSALLAALLASELVGARLAEGIAEVRAYVANPGSPSARETSLGLRLLSWQWGWEQFLANPVFGIGLGNFRSAVAAAVAAGTLPPILTTFGGLHNLFIDHLTTTGLVGTVAMLAFWVGALGHFIVARRSPDADKRLFATWGLVLLIGELVFSNVGSMFASSLGTLGFSVLLAVFAAGAHPATPARA